MASTENLQSLITSGVPIDTISTECANWMSKYGKNILPISIGSDTGGNKSMIIISTSFIGAYLIVFSIGKFIGMPKKVFSFQQFNVLREPGGQFFVLLFFCILVGMAGMIVQYKYTAMSAGDRVTGKNSN